MLVPLWFNVSMFQSDQIVIPLIMVIILKYIKILNHHGTNIML